MSAAELIQDLQRRGVRLIARGDRLAWEAPKGAVAATDLAALREQKDEVLAALRRDWTLEEWRGRYDERAGILEHEGGISLADAEAKAFLEVSVEWVAAHLDALPSSEAEPIAREALMRLGIPDPRLGAALTRSRFGEIWVVLTPAVRPELLAEEACRAEPRPVVFAEDVAKLRGRSDEMIQAALNVLTVFPGTRVES